MHLHYLQVSLLITVGAHIQGVHKVLSGLVPNPQQDLPTIPSYPMCTVLRHIATPTRPDVHWIPTSPRVLCWDRWCHRNSCRYRAMHRSPTARCRWACLMQLSSSMWTDWSTHSLVLCNPVCSSPPRSRNLDSGCPVSRRANNQWCGTPRVWLLLLWVALDYHLVLDCCRFWFHIPTTIHHGNHWMLWWLIRRAHESQILDLHMSHLEKSPAQMQDTIPTW